MTGTRMVRSIDSIAVHPAAHLEEYVGIWTARNVPQAEKAFPGISKAPVVFWGYGTRTPDGRPAAAWEAEGYYLLGVAGGEGDEHANRDRPRREKESALSLFVKQLGLEEEHWLKPVVDLITQEDLGAGTGGLAVPNIVKDMNWQFPEDWEYVMDWAMMGIGAIMKADIRGLKLAPDDSAYGTAKESVRQALSDAAEALGCSKQPWTTSVIDKMMSNLGPLCLPRLYALLNALYPDRQESNDRWLEEGAMAAMRSHERFFGGTRDEYLRKAEIEEVDIGKPEKLKMAVIYSDDSLIGKYALSKRGGKADIAVIKNSRGNVRILSRKELRLEMRDVVRVIRIREREANGCRDELSWKILEGEGIVSGAPNWIIHLEGRMILNGSTSAPDVEPTKLRLRDILDIIKDCLNPTLFEKRNRKRCMAGTCTTGISHECPLDRFGLLRCRSIRAVSKATQAMGRPAA